MPGQWYCENLKMGTNTILADHYKIQLPAGFAAMETQVAGHSFQTASIGLLQDGSGCVLKPLGKPECGERELSFYENLQLNESSPLLSELRAFVPKFYNKVKLVIHNHQHTFMKMEDLTRGMQKPCIMDIKVGKRTWDPLASEQKRQDEELKYAQCKQVLGLCIPGFQVYTLPERLVLRYSNEYGKKLDADGFRKTIAYFINALNGKVCRPLVTEILKQLYKIRDWFKVQRIYHFYSSSLLLVYDHVKLEQILSRSENSNLEQCNGLSLITNGDSHNFHSAHTSIEQFPEEHSTNLGQWVKVKMIDFAHVFPAENQSLDANYIFGLENLITVFEELL